MIGTSTALVAVFIDFGVKTLTAGDLRVCIFDISYNIYVLTR